MSNLLCAYDFAHDKVNDDNLSQSDKLIFAHFYHNTRYVGASWMSHETEHLVLKNSFRDHTIATIRRVQCSRPVNCYVDWQWVENRVELGNKKSTSTIFHSIYFIPKIVYSCHWFVGFYLNSYFNFTAIFIRY